MSEPIPGRRTIAISHDGRSRPYLLHLPAVPRPTPSGIPLVLQLHGRGIGPLAFDAWTGFTALAEEAGFAVAMPSAIDEIWNDGRFTGRPTGRVDDVGYLDAVLDDVARRLPVDPGRVHVVGMSNGATMAGRLACERGERLAAVAQVAGTAALAVVSACRPSGPLPVLSIHGSADRFAPYVGGRARGVLARLLIRVPAGPAIGVDDWARWWASANGATAGPVIERPSRDVTIRRWSGPTVRCDVDFWRVEGGGHTWPGSHGAPPWLGRRAAFDATRAIWSFFEAHPAAHDRSGAGRIGDEGVR